VPFSDSPAFRATRFLGDLGLALLAFTLAFLLRIRLPLPFTEALLPPDRLRFLASGWPVVLAAQVGTLYFFGFYDPPEPRSRSEAVRRLSAAAALQGLVLTGSLFLANRAFPRSVLVLYVVLDLAFLLLFRLVLDSTATRRVRRVAIVGGGLAAREIATAIRGHWHGLVVSGFVPLNGEGEEAGDLAPDPVLGPRLGSLDDLPALLADDRFDDIILAGTAESWQTRLIDSLAGSRPAHTNVLLLPGPFESLIGRMRYRWVHDVPLIEVVRESEWRINRPWKRLLDLSMGTGLLVASLPLLAACAVAVRVTSPGPILYRQIRIGRDRRPFTLWKLRTMRQDAEEAGDEVLAQPGDPRLTPIGAFLRRLRLDEVPQLACVLAGTMSLVGPRPERPGFVQKHLAEVPGYAERFSLAPGLTGLAQVNGDYHSSPQNKLRYELAYMGNWSLWLDLSILVRTVKIVLTSRGV